MLLTADGVTPIAPQDIVARLEAHNPRLGLRFVRSAAGPYWGVTEQWRSGDPRWVEVQRGHIPSANAFDLIHTFAPDFPPSSMASWIEGHYGPGAMSKDPAGDARRLVEAAQRSTAERQEAKMQKFEEDNEYKVKADTDHQRRVNAGAETAHPMVPGGLTKAETPAIPAKPPKFVPPPKAKGKPQLGEVLATDPPA